MFKKNRYRFSLLWKRFWTLGACLSTMQCGACSRASGLVSPSPVHLSVLQRLPVLPHVPSLVSSAHSSKNGVQWIPLGLKIRTCSCKAVQWLETQSCKRQWSKTNFPPSINSCLSFSSDAASRPACSIIWMRCSLKWTRIVSMLHEHWLYLAKFNCKLQECKLLSVCRESALACLWPAGPSAALHSPTSGCARASKFN